jgi:hypothetical protein
MHRLILLLILLSTLVVYSTSVNSTNTVAKWAKTIEGTGSTIVRHMSLDDTDGGLYVGGSFSEVATLEDGTHNLTSNGDTDMFLAKYSKSGEKLEWYVTYGGTGSDTISGVDTGSDGVYICGSFSSTVEFDSKHKLTAAGGEDLFVAKLNKQSGAVIWITSVGGVGNDNAYRVTVSKDGTSVYIVGTFNSNSISFDGKQTIYSNFYSSDMYLAKYKAADGQFEWVNTVASKGHDYGISISSSVEDDGVFVVGVVAEAITGQSQLTMHGKQDVVLAKYSSTGDMLWIKIAGSPETESAREVVATADGGALVCGTFQSTFIIDASHSYTTSGTSTYVIKYNSTGDVVWTAATSGTNVITDVYSLAESADGGAYIIGTFTGSVQFDENTILPFVTSDIFIAWYDETGNFTWVKTAGGTDYDYGYTIVATYDGFYAGGAITSTDVQFDSIALPSVNPASLDGFIVKYADPTIIPDFQCYGIAVDGASVCSGNVYSIAMCHNSN